MEIATTVSYAGLGAAGGRPGGLGTDRASDTGEVSPEEQRALRQLQVRDQEVRAHEQAHLRVGAELVRGGAHFSYQRGSDGRLYAVGGDVTIDTSAVPNDPPATIDKADHIKRTALAPTQPSPQDRAVAGQAARMALEAKMELAAQGQEAGAGRLNVYA